MTPLAELHVARTCPDPLSDWTLPETKDAQEIAASRALVALTEKDRVSLGHRYFSPLSPNVRSIRFFWDLMMSIFAWTARCRECKRNGKQLSTCFNIYKVWHWLNTPKELDNTSVNLLRI